MKMIATGSSSDVKIVLEDGEIFANKDVLSARCAYFATCFSNNKRKFIEGETNEVNFNHCSKVIMEEIIKYLFSGDMKLHVFLLADLLKMMNMTKMLMLDELLEDIQKFVLNYIQVIMWSHFLLRWCSFVVYTMEGKNGFHGVHHGS